jgi:hypothetical protein
VLVDATRAIILGTNFGFTSNLFVFPNGEVGPMSSRRMILWTLAMAYCGFLIAGRGGRSFDNNTISEAIIGAILGLLLAFLFTLRAKRKHV